MQHENLKDNSPGNESTSENRRRFLIGSAAGIRFGIDLREARGVSNFGRIIPVPGAPSSILGLTYFRGGIEAVVDLVYVWQGRNLSFADSARAILVESEGRRAILAVDNLLEFRECECFAAFDENDSGRLFGQIGVLDDKEVKIPVISVGLLLQSIN